MKLARFTAEEIKVAIQLIDIAVRAKGLDAAEPGYVIAKRLRDAPEESPPSGGQDLGGAPG